MWVVCGMHQLARGCFFFAALIWRGSDQEYQECRSGVTLCQSCTCSNIQQRLAMNWKTWSTMFCPVCHVLLCFALTFFDRSISCWGRCSSWRGRRAVRAARRRDRWTCVTQLCVILCRDSIDRTDTQLCTNGQEALNTSRSSRNVYLFEDFEWDMKSAKTEDAHIQRR